MSYHSKYVVNLDVQPLQLHIERHIRKQYASFKKLTSPTLNIFSSNLGKRKMTKGNKWFTKHNTEKKQNMFNVNPANMWGALGHVTRVTKPVTIHKQERDEI